MISAVIIDDVEKARVALKSDLDDYCETIELIGEADGVASGIALIEAKDPDLVFLDIRMGDGSGFDLIEHWRSGGEVPFQVIFTTAYDEYAIKAFKFSALDYLLKPIDPEDLIAAVEKVSTQEKVQVPENLQTLMENLMSQHQKAPKRIALSSTEKVQIVNIADIVRLEAHKNYTLFFLVDGEQILVTKTMKEYDDLFDGLDFYRCHHSHLVNLSFVKEFVKIDGTYLVMQDGANVPVSVRKRDGLMKKLSGA